MSDHDRNHDDHLAVLAWNAYMGNRTAQVTDALMDWTEPRHGDLPVIVLNEVMRHHAALHTLRRERGYRVLTEVPEDRDQRVIPEEGNTALLVPRRTMEVIRWAPKPMRTPWVVVSHNQRHDPRRHVGAMLAGTPIGRVKMTADHWPTNGLDGPSGRAVRECVEFTHRRLKHGPRAIALSVGDKNMGLEALRDLFPEATVRGDAPDAMLADGARRVHAEILARRGSDHPAIRYRVWA